MTRVNLVSNTSFKTDTTGWSAAENIKKRIVNSQRSSITTRTITNSYRTGTTVTITTSASHGILVGDSVAVSGTNGNSAIEGTFVVTEVTSNTFKYTTVSSGTITSAPDTGTVDLLKTGKTVTLTTATDHGFIVGDSVTVSGTNGNSTIEGTWVILTTPTTLTFTYESTSRGVITSAADTGTASVFGISAGTVTKTITNSYRTGSTAQITTSTAHGFCAGDIVTIAGTNGNAPLHGTYTITAVPSATTFNYTTGTSGTITSAADTGTAVVVGTSISRVTTEYYVGSSSLQITKSPIANSGVVTTDRISVQSSTSYAFSAYAKIPTTQEAASLNIRVSWYNASTGGSLISTVTDTAISFTTDVTSFSQIGNWVQLGAVFTAPATATYATLAIIQPTLGTASKTFLVDAVLIETSTTVNEYIRELTQAEKNQKANLSLVPLPQPHLTGMKLKSDIRLNGLTLNTVDENGVVWVATGIKGWWVHPEPQMSDFRRGWGDGEYDVKGRYAARLIELEGVFLPTDPSQVAAARNKLVEATNLVYNNGVFETDENPTKFSYVRLNGAPQIETVGARGRTEFSIGLKAADPIKYEWYTDPINPDPEGYRTTNLLAKNASLSRTGITTITNAGNYPVPVYFEINGPGLGNLQVVNATSGDFIIITGTLRGSATLTVTNKVILNEVATLTLSAAHSLVEGDLVTVSSVGSPFDGEITVTATTSTTFSYSVSGASNVASAASSGSVVFDGDLLEIDTYNRQVTYNGGNGREKLEILLDWILLQPGDNEIQFYEKLTSTTYANSTATLDIYYRSGWLA
jgi:hypothetical protein